MKDEAANAKRKTLMLACTATQPLWRTLLLVHDWGHDALVVEWP